MHGHPRSGSEKIEFTPLNCMKKFAMRTTFKDSINDTVSSIKFSRHFIQLTDRKRWDGLSEHT
jgi:hypothetical protein